MTIQEISYSTLTLIDNTEIKHYLIQAETKLAEGHYLEAVFACRDAFELGGFLLCNHSYHINKLAALPHIKKESMELYYYIQSLDEEISILGTNISMSDYRQFIKYLNHIPSQYRASRIGYSVMQRDWEKRDADFCYAFAAQIILHWQLTQEKPLYEVDMSGYSSHRRDLWINGVMLPEIYVEKSCIYLNDTNMGELRVVTGETKALLSQIKAGDIWKLTTRNTVEKTEVILNEFSEYIVVDAIEFNLVLNNGPLWELMIYYRIIPFTTRANVGVEIDIDKITEYTPTNETDLKAKELITEFGTINSIDRAFELERILMSNKIDSPLRISSYSSSLILILTE